MKLVKKVSFAIATIAVLFSVGCIAGGDISEESLGLRKTDLYSESKETVGEKAEYSKQYAGSSTKIKRAFQDAPPMIPHNVEGMLPIKINSNMCKNCHMPAVAAAMKATPMPESHFIDFRPSTAIGKDGRLTKNGVSVDNTSSASLEDVSIKKIDKLSGSRFNCTLCHAPQSKGQAVENIFEADFTSKDGASKSSWSGATLMEGIDTLK